MKFADYLNNEWGRHAKDAAAVAADFLDSEKLISESSHVAQLANLIVHVMGEHLGRFQDGISLLKKLEANSFNDDESKRVLNRSQAILAYTENKNFKLEEFSQSEQARIMATVAGALAGQNRINEAAACFTTCCELMKNIDNQDVAHRAFAISANNLASALEEKETRTDEDKKLMIAAAHAARKHWGIAGTWLQIERAEYRLAHSYIKAQDYINAIKHANLCLTICEQNSAPALEFFFAFEPIALIEKALTQPPRSIPQMQKYFDQLAEADQSWCRDSLKKLL